MPSQLSSHLGSFSLMPSTSLLAVKEGKMSRLPGKEENIENTLCIVGPVLCRFTAQRPLAPPRSSYSAPPHCSTARQMFPELSQGSCS